VIDGDSVGCVFFCGFCPRTGEGFFKFQFFFFFFLLIWGRPCFSFTSFFSPFMKTRFDQEPFHSSCFFPPFAAPSLGGGGPLNPSPPPKTSASFFRKNRSLLLFPPPGRFFVFSVLRRGSLNKPSSFFFASLPMLLDSNGSLCPQLDPFCGYHPPFSPRRHSLFFAYLKQFNVRPA